MKKRGFTLLETLVALAILSIALSGVFGLLPRGLVGARSAMNQIIANNLAIEAMELVRNMRDNSMFFGGGGTDDPDAWLGKLRICKESLCYVDPVNHTVWACDEESGCPILQRRMFDGDIEIYGNGSDFSTSASTPTIFKRTISIKDVNNPVPRPDGTSRTNVEVLVRVLVTWKDGGRVDKSMAVESNLFDWLTYDK